MSGKQCLFCSFCSASLPYVPVTLQMLRVQMNGDETILANAGLLAPLRSGPFRKNVTLHLRVNPCLLGIARLADVFCVFPCVSLAALQCSVISGLSVFLESSEQMQSGHMPGSLLMFIELAQAVIYPVLRQCHCNKAVDSLCRRDRR